MTYEVWIKEIDDVEEITLLKKDCENYEIEIKDAKMLASFEAIDYDSAMKQYHELMGWEEYKPF